MAAVGRGLVVMTIAGVVAGCGAAGSSSSPDRASGSARPGPPSLVAAQPSASGSALAAGAVAGLHGLGVSPQPRKPPLVLKDTTGRSYDLRAETKGRLTYLYFGYTHCPDACPTTMADIASAIRSVRPALRRDVAVVFVTTDPRRDDPQQLRTWLDRFNPSFVGLTGSAAQIAQAERQAGVPLAAPESDGKGGYGVSHSTEVFAFSPDDVSHVVYADGFAPSDYAHDLPLLLAFRA